MTTDGRRRDADPFADFRSGGTSVRPDDRLEVQTTYDLGAAPPQVSPPAPPQVSPPAPPQVSPPAPPQAATPPQQAVQPLRPAPQLIEQQPLEESPLEHAPPEPGTAAADESRPRTRREAREAAARLAGQQPQVVPPRRPESPPQGRPDGSDPEDTQPQPVQRVEVQRFQPPAGRAAQALAGGSSGPGHVEAPDEHDVAAVRISRPSTTATETDDPDGAGHDGAGHDGAGHDENSYAENGHDENGYHDQYGYHDDAHPDGAHPDGAHPDGAHPDGAHPDGQAYYHDDDGYDGYHDGYDDEQLRAERGATEREGKRRRSRGPRRVLVLLAVLAVLGLGSYAAWAGLQPAIQRIRDQFAPAADFPGPGTGEALIRIEEGDTGRDIGQKLLDAGVVASVDAFNDAAKANPDWVSVQFGDYRLAQQLPAADAVLALLDEDNKVVNRVTIPEGRRTVDVLVSLSEQTGIPVEEFTAAALSLPLPPQAALNLPAEQRPPNTVGDTEGWLFPETYDLGLEPTAKSILQQMLDRTQAVLTEQGVPEDQWLTVLTKASLVQAEARLPDDFGRVAQVTENRLSVGVPTANGNGTIRRIQYDSTTIYAAGRANGVPNQAELDSLNPYNTRAVDGLPPGAINNPGLQAIQAVLSPTPGDWLFFTTIDLCTGETLFQATADAATQDAAQFQEWDETAPRNPDGSYDCP